MPGPRLERDSESPRRLEEKNEEKEEEEEKERRGNPSPLFQTRWHPRKSRSSSTSAHFSGASRSFCPGHTWGTWNPLPSRVLSPVSRFRVSRRHARMIKKKGKESRREEKRKGKKEEKNMKRKEKQGRTSSYRPVLSHAMQYFALPFVTPFTQFIALRPASVCFAASSCRVSFHALARIRHLTRLSLPLSTSLSFSRSLALSFALSLSLPLSRSRILLYARLHILLIRITLSAVG